MANKYSTKKALISCVVMLALCFTSFVGTTFAWFTDSVTSAGNVIQSGNLDVAMYWADGTEDPNTATWTDASTGPIFDYDNWEPGYVQVRHIKIANEGTLALKYAISILANGMVSDLSDVIDVYYTDPATQVNERTELVEGAKLGTLTDALENLGASGNGTLKAGESHVVTIAFKMRESAGNDYMGKSIGTNFSVQLLATQVTYEKDSFGDAYDALALYPDGSYRIQASNETANGTEGETVTLKNDTATFIVKSTTGTTGNVAATIAETSVRDAVFAIANAQGLSVAAYDIKVTGQEADSPVEVQLFVGKMLTGVTLYHNDTAMATADYSYDPTTGFVTFTTDDFSDFAVTYAEKADNAIGAYEDIVKNQDGSYVLSDHFEASNIIHFGSGIVTLDLNGKEITAGNPGQYIIGAQKGGSLTLNGNGTVNAGKGFMANKEGATIVINGGTYHMTQTSTLNSIKHTSVAQNDSKIVVNGGTFTTNVEDAVLFFATSNATIEINGGFFENTADETPDLLGMGTNRSNTNRIIITGGTFVNYNPMEDRMTYTGEWPENGMDAFSGPWMIIPDGYTVVSETQANGDVWYSVVPVQK